MKILRACWYEFKLAILRSIRYRVGFVSDILIFSVVFFIILFTNDGQGLSLAYNASESDAKVMLLIGYIFWLFSSTALGDSNNVISNEATAGTLETKLLSACACTLACPACIGADLRNGIHDLRVASCRHIRLAARGKGLCVDFSASGLYTKHIRHVWHRPYLRRHIASPQTGRNAHFSFSSGASAFNGCAFHKFPCVQVYRALCFRHGHRAQSLHAKYSDAIGSYPLLCDKRFLVFAGI